MGSESSPSIWAPPRDREGPTDRALATLDRRCTHSFHPLGARRRARVRAVDPRAAVIPDSSLDATRLLRHRRPVRRGRFHRVYSAFHPFEAHFVRTVLESHGLWATVQNENLAPYGVGAEVWVEAAQTDEALAVIREIQSDPAGHESGRLSLTDDARGGELATTASSDAPSPSDDAELRPSADGVEGGPCPECGLQGVSKAEPCPACGFGAED